VMARYWTSPDHPLWLMSDQAGIACLKKLLPGYSATDNNFAKITQRTGLKRATQPPIKKITAWQGSRICGFTLAGDLADDVADQLSLVLESFKKG